MHVVTTFFDATHILRSPVDKGGPLHVGLEEVVHRVFLREAAVHGYHGGLKHDVRVAEVRHDLVNAGNEIIKKHTRSG